MKKSNWQNEEKAIFIYKFKNCTSEIRKFRKLEVPNHKHLISEEPLHGKFENAILIKVY